MVNYREILRLTSLDYTQRQIDASIHSFRSTISEVQELARKADLSFPLDESVTNEVLLMTFHPDRITATHPRVEPDYSYIHKELANSGVNLSLLWTEKYRHWARLTKATMRIQHKPGNELA